MSILKLTNDLKNITSVVYRPKVKYTSSSVAGETGLKTISTLETPRIKGVAIDKSSYYEENSNISPGYNPANIIDKPADTYTGIDIKQIKKQEVDRYDFKVDARCDSLLTKDLLAGNIHLEFDNVRRGILDINDAAAVGLSNFSPPFVVEYLTQSLRSWEQQQIYSSMKNSLFPSHASRYNDLHFGFANYNCLNFFTGSSVANDTCLMYPNRSIGTDGSNGALKSTAANAQPYTPSDGFTFDFYINPKYSTDHTHPYDAGTIFHISSSLSVSLVSGSQRDEYNNVNTFRLMLQLSGAADRLPSSINLNTINNTTPGTEAVYISNEKLLKNHWHKVTIKWNSFIKTGKILIDDDETSFYYPSSSISNPVVQSGQNAVFIGNYFEGKHDIVNRFFNLNANKRSGIFQEYLNGYTHENTLVASPPTDPDTDFYNFRHPLNAEIHDIKLYDRLLTENELKKINDKGNILDPVFYVPVFFTTNVSKRDVQVSQTSSDHTFRTINHPVNSNFSMGIGGHQINLENFTKEFIHKNIPRLHNLTASLIGSHDNNITTNQYIYQQKSQRKRNLTVLPCDNGKCIPDYGILLKDRIGPKYNNTKSDRENIVAGNEVTGEDRFFDNFRKIAIAGPYIDTSRINNQSILNYIENVDAKKLGVLSRERFLDYIGAYVYPHNRLMIANKFPGPIPSPNNPKDHELEHPILTSASRGYHYSFQNPGIAIYEGGLGDSLDHVNRFLHAKVFNEGDATDITLLSFSNLIYGEKIHPGSMTLIDNDVTGSNGIVSIKMKDDGKGSLYRCDSKTQHATWASIGNVLYDEGLVLVKHPSLKYFGSDDYECEFSGEQTTHVMTINAPAPRDLFLFSTNPTYQVLSASNDFDDANNKFVYISGVNIHDEDLNIIMKTTLAQPVVKRRNDELMFKIKMDF